MGCSTCESCFKIVCTCRDCEHCYSLQSDETHCKCRLRKRKCPYGVDSKKWNEEVEQSK